MELTHKIKIHLNSVFIVGDTDICHCHPGDVFNCAEKQCSLCSRGWTGLPKCKKGILLQMFLTIK